MARSVEGWKDVIAERYRRFARNEARGQSPIYETLAHHVASSDKLLTFLASLPVDRQQPNLLFAAVRHVVGTPVTTRALEEAVERKARAIGTVMRTRTTQTNEPARCAVLLPALARLPQPLAILEVGASAGLCLLPDRYGYDYVRYRIAPPADAKAIAPILRCDANDLTPLPRALPQIGWRAGLDLNPLSVASARDVEWLEALIWPEHKARRERLLAAIEICRQQPPKVLRGDLLKDVETTIRSAPPATTTVVFHTAVLGYVSGQADRDTFARTVRALGAVWISNEAPHVYPNIAAKVKEPIRLDRFLLAVDGEPVAWTGPHGQSIDWFDRG
jgi:hypothetical protein